MKTLETFAPDPLQRVHNCRNVRIINRNFFLKLYNFLRELRLFILTMWSKKCRDVVEDTRLEAKDTKNPRPRPRQPFRGQALSRTRTGMLEAKAKDQGHRRKCSPKKKGLQNNFLGNLQFIGVARIVDWGGLNHKSHAMTSSKICLLALNQDFGKGRRLKLI